MSPILPLLQRHAPGLSRLTLALLIAGCGSVKPVVGTTHDGGPKDGAAGAGDVATGGAGAGGGGGSAGALGGAGGASGGGAGSSGGMGGGVIGGDAGVLAGADGGAHDAIDPAGRGPAVVTLGGTNNLATAGSYVILAKTGITNATGSIITGGALGVSPEKSTSITGFALIEDSTTVFATSVSVAPPGKIYASNYAIPTPTNLTTAILSMQAAYTDAAGRANPDFLDLASGNLGGRTLVPGLYKWNGNVTVPNDVTIAGGAKDVWIFQVSGDVDVSASKKVILSGGALAKNIFWQVAGQATIHANAHFEGIILSKTGITLQTTASMNGRLLAQSLVAIDNNAITAP